MESRFWRHVHPEPSPLGCWHWAGALHRNGYGKIGRGGRGAGTMTTHRAAWELFRGDIPAELHVLHKCDVRHCVNPEHLFLGTESDNRRDQIAKGRFNSRKGHCGFVRKDEL